MGRNDDAPDGLQMAVALAVAVKSMAKKTDYKSVLKAGHAVWGGSILMAKKSKKRFSPEMAKSGRPIMQQPLPSVT